MELAAYNSSMEDHAKTVGNLQKCHSLVFILLEIALDRSPSQRSKFIPVFLNLAKYSDLERLLALEDLREKRKKNQNDIIIL